MIRTIGTTLVLTPEEHEQMQTIVRHFRLRSIGRYVSVMLGGPGEPIDRNDLLDGPEPSVRVNVSVDRDKWAGITERAAWNGISNRRMVRLLHASHWRRLQEDGLLEGPPPVW